MKRASDGTVVAEVSADAPESVLVDEEQLRPTGLELAMRQMKANETAVITVEPGQHGYPEGHPAGGEALKAELTLLEFDNGTESWDCTTPEKLVQAAQRHQMGNRDVAAGKLDRAFRRYMSAKNYVNAYRKWKGLTVRALRGALEFSCLRVFHSK